MLSAVITCDATRNPIAMLSQNRQAFVANECEIIVVGFNISPEAKALIIPHTDMLISINGRGFNKALGINLGVMASKNDKLLLIDSDIVIKPKIIGVGLSAISKGGFATIKLVRESVTPEKYSPPVENWLRMYFGDKNVDVLMNKTYPDGSRSGPGIVFLRKEWFCMVGGMNSKMEGWGWEDIDLIVRLCTKLGLARKQIGCAVHLSHHELTSRSCCARRVSEAKNMHLALQRYHESNFDGTYFADIQRSDISYECVAGA